MSAASHGRRLGPRLPTRAMGALLALTLAALPARAGGNLEAIVNNSTAIADAAWDLRALPITWQINSLGVIGNCNNGNPECVGGISPLTLERAVAALTAGFNAWQEIPTSRIAFTYGGATTQAATGLDAVHLITWADPDASLCPTGVVARTPSTRLDADLIVNDTNRYLGTPDIVLDPEIYPNGTLLKAGTIVDADMIWCPAEGDVVDRPLDSSGLVFDLQAVGTHEIGHLFGLAHSPLIAPLATMFPFVDRTAAFAEDVRVPARDDVAAASRYYPEPAFATDHGTIAGRLVIPGTTTGADGVSVTAFRPDTGEALVGVISISRFSASGLPAGTFRIDGLPPGSYRIGLEYFDSDTAVRGDADWWENNRYNSTVYNGNVTPGAPGSQTLDARPEFVSSPEDSADDLAPAITVDVAAGATVVLADVPINLDPPPSPAGATALAIDDGQAVQVNFPTGFTFPFYGRSWASVFVNDNGNLTFGAASTSAHSGNFLGPDTTTGGAVPPRIALLMTTLDPGFDNRGQSGGAYDVFADYISDGAGERVEIAWLGIPYSGTLKAGTAVARLFRDGRVEIQYHFFPAWWGIAGLSPGWPGTGPLPPAVELDLSRQLPYAGAAGQAVYERFRFNQPTTYGGTNFLGDASDMNGIALVFQPNAAGGYDVTSPDLVPLPPAAVTNLRLLDATTLAWDAGPGAATYNLYRGDVRSLADTDGDGASQAYGACLLSGIASPAGSDAAVPDAGRVFFYIATGENRGGEGPLGVASSGATRPNVNPCP